LNRRKACANANDSEWRAAVTSTSRLLPGSHDRRRDVYSQHWTGKSRMNERELREFDRGGDGRPSLPPRLSCRKMVGLGLTGPLRASFWPTPAWRKLAPAPTTSRTKAGGGGALKTLFWQGATLLQSAFAVGSKDRGLAYFLRAVAAVGSRRHLVPVPCRRDSRNREWRDRGRRDVCDLEAEKGRAVARRPTLHRR